MAYRTSGEVTSGLGKGKEFVTLDGYVEQFREKLGYEPFPGTLNLELEGPPDGEFADMEPIRIDGWEDGDRSFGVVDCYPATVDREGDDTNVPLHVLVPRRTDHDPSTLEIIAPVNLRDALDLDDGTVVKVWIESG